MTDTNLSVEELRGAAVLAVALKQQLEEIDDQREAEAYKLERVANQFLSYIPGKNSHFARFKHIEGETAVFDTYSSNWETLDETNHGEVEFTFKELAEVDQTKMRIRANSTKEAEKARQQEIRLLEQRLERAKARKP